MTDIVSTSWIAPDGTEFPFDGNPLFRVQGATGLNAVPRTVTTQSLPTGGAFGRWSHAEPRAIALPIACVIDSGANDLMQYWRSFVRGVLATTPVAGAPVPGKLRIGRSDGTYREVSCVYQSGLEGDDSSAQELVYVTAALSLIAPDPWFYGPNVYALQWKSDVTRSYLSPYETVSAGLQFGQSHLNVAGDVDALPVWTITGPCSSLTAIRGDGAQWKLNTTLSSEQSRVIDVSVPTVTDGSGASKVGELDWPTSSLWTLPPGDQTITLNVAGSGPGTTISLQYRPRWETQ